MVVHFAPPAYPWPLNQIHHVHPRDAEYFRTNCLWVFNRKIGLDETLEERRRTAQTLPRVWKIDIRHRSYSSKMLPSPPFGGIVTALEVGRIWDISCDACQWSIVTIRLLYIHVLLTSTYNIVRKYIWSCLQQRDLSDSIQIGEIRYNKSRELGRSCLVVFAYWWGSSVRIRRVAIAILNPQA